MKLIPKDEMLYRLKTYHEFSNDALQRKASENHTYYEFNIDSFDFFSKLIFHSISYTQILTPKAWYGAKSYTVGDAAQRLIDLDVSFEDLQEGRVKGTYLPPWFRSCVSLHREFSYDKFQSILIEKGRWAELRDCPGSLFRLVDGAHRTLVLSYMVLKGDIEFKPVSGVLVV